MSDRAVDSSPTEGNSRLRTGVKGVLALVASGALIVWVGSTIWDNLERDESVRLIRSGTVDERRLAAENLRRATGDREIDRAIAALREALGDEDAQVRAEAITSLAGLVRQARDSGTASAASGPWEKRFEVAMRGLIPLLSDPDPGVRTAAVIGLAVIAPGVNPPPELVAALRDESAAVRAAAARALVPFGPGLDPEIPTLIALMERDEMNVRGACAEALHAAQPHPALVPTLIGFLDSPDRNVRAITADLLGRIGPDARGAIPALIKVLKEPFGRERDRSWSVSPEPARSTARALGKMGPSREAIAALIEVISPEKIERIMASLRGLGGVRTLPDEARAAFAELGRINAAVQGLGEIGPPAVAAVPALITVYEEVLASRQHAIAHIAIPRALARIAPNSAAAPGVVAVLVRALDSTDRSIRLGAAEALGQFGKDAIAAIPRLRAVREDSDASVRDAAKKSIAALERASPPDASKSRTP
ncbi:MAG TPA: HEAT repeat domain-containing protein [Isosphaeraceae bacterium]|nr:HEAT repeat domain-containing protein [Isosphaeraceae bacterium]